MLGIKVRTDGKEETHIDLPSGETIRISINRLPQYGWATLLIYAPDDCRIKRPKLVKQQQSQQ